MLYLDLETRSQCDIARGVLHYAQDPTTSVICMAYTFDDGPIHIWFAEDDPEFPVDVIDYIKTGGTLVAHNAAFERHLFDFVLSNDYDFKPPKLEQWHCSAARAMAHGLPAKLDEVCRAMDLPVKKMTEGARLIRDYSVDRAEAAEWKAGDKELMGQYCMTDVEVMRDVCSILRPLEPYEWEQYHITEQINDRGVPIDIPLARSAVDYAQDIYHSLNRRIYQLTDGVVPRTAERAGRDRWLRARLSDEQLELIEEEGKIRFDKAHRAKLREAKDLPLDVAELIEIIESAGGSTVAKYSSMLKQQVAGRVHGSLIWSGAGATGRYSSRGLQLQNFRRDVFKDPEPYIDAVLSHAPLDNAADVLGRLIRSAIATKHGLTFSDYSQIEARVLPWLSGLPSAEKTLDIFRNGRDLYTETAVWMFDLRSADDVTPDLRQSSKQGNLACGFGGGARAVQAMARGYGIEYSFDKADKIKSAWRTANPWASVFWYSLKDAMQEAIRIPNLVTSAGRIRFMYNGYDWLWMMLPSGRCLAYFKPKFELVTYPWGDEGWEVTCIWGSARPKKSERKWPRRTLNHLILSENATQATAADIMRETIVRAHKAGLDVLFSVHDELVLEGCYANELHDIMVQPPNWAAGLPINAETQTGNRYGK